MTMSLLRHVVLHHHQLIHYGIVRSGTESNQIEINATFQLSRHVFQYSNIQVPLLHHIVLHHLFPALIPKAVSIFNWLRAMSFVLKQPFNCSIRVPHNLTFSIFLSSARSTNRILSQSKSKLSFFQRLTIARISHHAFDTSGSNDPVCVHKEPYSNRPKFSKLSKDLQTEACVIGSGIAGISTAYELVNRGIEVVMTEARDVISGESGRTSGHLSSALDASYDEIASKHGSSGAKAAAESHLWATKRVREISKQLGIECEYREIPDYEIS